MKIQPVESYAFSAKRKVDHSKIKQTKTNNICFRSYNDALQEALTKELVNPAEVSKVATNAFIELLNEAGTQARPAFSLVKDWIFTKPTFFVEEICKPIKKIYPPFRALIKDSDDKDLEILQGVKDTDSVFLTNLGKYGFFNNLFNFKFARNDMRLVFKGDAGEFEISTDKKGNLEVEQSFKGGHWEKYTYDRFYNRVTQKKEGNYSDDYDWSA